MYKLKTDWYFAMSKKRSANFSTQEKDLWALVLDGKLDDFGEALGSAICRFLPLVYHVIIVREHRRQILDDFGMKLFAEIQKSADAIGAFATDAHQVCFLIHSFKSSCGGSELLRKATT